MARQTEIVTRLIEQHGPAEEIRITCPHCRAPGCLVVDLRRRLVHCVMCAHRSSIDWLLDPTDPVARERATRRLMRPDEDIIR